MSKPRIVQLIAEMGIGGAEAVVATLSEGLVNHGFPVAIASSGGHWEQILRQKNIPTYRVRLTRRKPWLLVNAVRDVIQVYRDYRPDIIHAHNIGMTFIAWLALRICRYKAPIITTFHGVAESEYSRAARILRHCADIVVVVSPCLIDKLVTGGLDPDRITVITNAIEHRQYPAMDSARTQLALDGYAPLAICAARLIEQKRHDILLRAWALCVSRWLEKPEFVSPLLLIVGDGPNRKELESLTHELKISDYVQFTGRRTDVPILLAAAEIFVLSSDWEGLPLAVLEAMDAGIPVVATSVDGLAEFAQSGSAALVPRGDIDQFAEALFRVVSDSDYRQQIVTNARCELATTYHPDTLLDKYMQVFIDQEESRL